MTLNSNVIYISGIEEQEDVLDSDLFTQLCEKKLGLQIYPVSTRRIPNENGNGVRMLQVVLKSERERWQILSRMKSKHLRLLDPNSLMNSMTDTINRMRQRFVNFDALLADLERCSRRHSNSVLGHILKFKKRFFASFGRLTVPRNRLQCLEPPKIDVPIPPSETMEQYRKISNADATDRWVKPSPPSTTDKKKRKTKKTSSEQENTLDIDPATVINSSDLFRDESFSGQVKTKKKKTKSTKSSDHSEINKESGKFESTSSCVDNSELSEDVVASETVYVHDAETVQHKSRKKLSKTKIAFQTSTLNGVGTYDGASNGYEENESFMTAENSLSQTSDSKKQKRKKKQESSDATTKSTQNQNSESAEVAETEDRQQEISTAAKDVNRVKKIKRKKKSSAAKDRENDWEDEATVDVGQPISGANAEPIKSSRPGKSTSFSRTLDNITQRLARLRHPASFGFDTPYGKAGAYEKLEKLGQGTYATVYRGISRLNNQTVALKEFQLRPQEGTPYTAIREASLLKELKHNNIVVLHDIVQTKSTLTFVFEYVPKDLSRYLAKSRNGLAGTNCKLFLFQLLRGLSFCHERRILHRDLKPQNLLITPAGVLKIADFGLARAKSVPSHTYSSEVVTLWYRPPDVLLGSTDYTTSLDMWGVGCIFVEMLLGHPVFPGSQGIWDQLDQIWQVFGTPTEETWEDVSKYPNYEPERFIQYSPRPLRHVTPRICEMLYAEDLALKLLQLQPERRLDAKEAMTHNFFQDLPSAIYRLGPHESVYSIPGIYHAPELDECHVANYV